MQRRNRERRRRRPVAPGPGSDRSAALAGVTFVVLDLVVAHQVAFDEADERQGKPIAEVYPWEYDALLAMIVAAVGE